MLAHGFLSRRNACAVHQAHQLAQRHRLGDHGLAVGFVADVALDESAANFLRNGLAFFGLHVGNHHGCAMGAKHAGSALTQT